MHMKQDGMSVEFLGTRGSVPVFGQSFQIFGGATSCVRVLAGRQEIYLDAGSGMVNVAPMRDTDIAILLTHPHIDHLLGLSFFEGLSQPGRKIRLYMKEREGRGLAQVLDTLYAPPFWPIAISEYPAEVQMMDDLPPAISLEEVQVRSMEGNHPGGSTILRLDYKEASLVFATDFERTDEKLQELIRFAEGASLLIYDGAYSEEEYTRKKGFGHSTFEKGIYVAEQAAVKQLAITHYSPHHNDEELLDMEAACHRLRKDSFFARCGERREL